MAEFWSAYLWPTLWIVMQIVVILIPLLLSVAYLTYAERKVIGAMQLRQGPMVVGPMGLLQPIADVEIARVAVGSVFQAAKQG